MDKKTEETESWRRQMDQLTAAGTERWLGKLGRHVYAFLCLGVVLIAATFVHYAFPEQPTGDAGKRSRRRLAAVQAADF
ncbi:putative homeobox-leucine zipper protein ROC8 [Cocos nucifera]|uniref:Putative homeobox-leucine zipper protein ROC8 n=1 Tax=Cocos nucifera TaxID=13894 RepID=A0A8K0IBX0_COCNU|nr:putative homeobox-leucine zipper protein ROC8 [Cocos nucifera]